jgi:hypothetical protein
MPSTPTRSIPADNNRTRDIKSAEVANSPSVEITSAVGALSAVYPLELAGLAPPMLPLGSRWVLRVIPDSFSDQVLFWINMGDVAVAGSAGEPFWSYEGTFPLSPVLRKQGLSIIKDSRTDIACKVYLFRKDQ